MRKPISAVAIGDVFYYWWPGQPDVGEAEAISIYTIGKSIKGVRLRDIKTGFEKTYIPYQFGAYFSDAKEDVTKFRGSFLDSA